MDLEGNTGSLEEDSILEINHLKELFKWSFDKIPTFWIVKL